MVNHLVIENLKHRPVRTGLSILAIAFSVTLVLTIVGLSDGMLEDNRERARGAGADVIFRSPTASFGTGGGAAPLNEKLIPYLETQPHVTIAAGVLMHSLQFPNSLHGIDLDRSSRMAGGIRFLSGGPFRQETDIIVDEFYAREKKLRVGSKIPLLNKEWIVCGIVESGKLGRMFVQLPVLQDLTSNPGRITQIYLKVDRPENIPAVVAGLKKNQPDYGVNTMEEVLSAFSADKVPALTIFLKVIVGISVAIGFIFVFLSMYTAVLERTREIGILKALGASPAFIVNILLRESLLLAVLGAITGILFSFGTRYLFLVTIPASMQQKITPLWWPKALLIALLGALLGTLYPGLKAAKQDAIEALSYD
ncbi:MAG: ABC transporter permease [Bryobacteraceae bacterium]|nr:ABC transporter permease [Bryobacteraceae bacterium]